MKYSDHIFFDLDRTLWDYDANATETLTDLFEKYRLKEFGDADCQTFLNVFFLENEKLWERFDNGDIEKDYIRQQRFPLVFEKVGISGFVDAEQFQEDFLNQCPRKGKLLPGATEVLEELCQYYAMSIITNGFDQIQLTKLKSSGIDHYFEHIITSEVAGFQKPSKEIFEFALEQCGAKRDLVIMVGDNLETDVKGAREAGIDQVFFNRSAEHHNQPVTHEIDKLSDLRQILL